MKLDCGSEIVDPTPERVKRLSSSFGGFERFGCKMVMPGEFFVPNRFTEMANEMYNFPVQETDVFVTSFLKTGSTWLQEIVWGILHNPNLDHPASEMDSYVKCPWFETPAMLKKEDIPRVMVKDIPEEISIFQAYSFLEKPRVFKTHILFSLLNPDTINKAKVVYVIRDPRDTCLSYFHFTSGVRLYSYRKSLENFVEDFINGNTFSGSYVNHLKQWWKVKDNPNVYTVYYENIKKNTEDELKKLGEFLGVKLSDKQVENIKHYTSFGEMKKRDILAKSQEARDQFLVPESKGFFRKGEAGTAENEMTPELRETIAKHFRENLGEVKLPYNLE